MSTPEENKDTQKGSDPNSGNSEGGQIPGVNAQRRINPIFDLPTMIMQDMERSFARYQDVDKCSVTQYSWNSEVGQLYEVDAPMESDQNFHSTMLLPQEARRSRKRYVDNLLGDETLSLNERSNLTLDVGNSYFRQLRGVDAPMENYPKVHFTNPFSPDAWRYTKRYVDNLLGDETLSLNERSNLTLDVGNSEVGQLAGVDAPMGRDLDQSSTISSREHWQYNKAVLESLKPGDMLHIDQGLFDHTGIYVGNGEVVHLCRVDGAGRSDLIHPSTLCGGDSDHGRVSKVDYWKAVGESKVHKINSKDKELKPLESSDIVERALSEVGKIGYNLVYKNCEHFATWCRYGTAESEQTEGIQAGLDSTLWTGLVWAVCKIVLGD